jgi:hypothetical protein
MLLFQIRDSLNLEGKVPVFIPPPPRVRGILRPTASLSWCQATIWACDQFFFLFEIFLRQLRVYFIVPSLTRGRVCNLLLLLRLASAVPSRVWVLRDSRPYFIFPIFETPPTWRARFPNLYPPGTGWSSYILGHWVPFQSLVTTRLHTGNYVENTIIVRSAEVLCSRDCYSVAGVIQRVNT